MISSPFSIYSSSQWISRSSLFQILSSLGIQNTTVSWFSFCLPGHTFVVSSAGSPFSWANCWAFLLLHLHSHPKGSLVLWLNYHLDANESQICISSPLFNLASELDHISNYACDISTWITNRHLKQSYWFPLNVPTLKLFFFQSFQFFCLTKNLNIRLCLAACNRLKLNQRAVFCFFSHNERTRGRQTRAVQWLLNDNNIFFLHCPHGCKTAALPPASHPYSNGRKRKELTR